MSKQNELLGFGGMISSRLPDIESVGRALDLEGLPDRPFHALRHSFATLMLSAREHPKVVQEMLGHSRVNTTLDFYSHVLPDMQREAIDRLDVMLS